MSLSSKDIKIITSKIKKIINEGDLDVLTSRMIKEDLQESYPDYNIQENKTLINQVIKDQLKEDIMYYGELKCIKTKGTGENCTNGAYYVGQLCGVHCKKDKRVLLPKNPNKKLNEDLKYKQEKIEYDEVANKNKSENKKGIIVLEKLLMMKNPRDIKGFVKIYPNNKHGNKKDGIGLPELSPMRLGPVIHGQPNMPPSQNIENWWQGSKVFVHELDEDNEPKDIFYETQKNFFLDPIAHRHKSKSKMAYSLHAIDGVLGKYKYIESRKFYCDQYIKLAKETESFKKLKNMMDNGYNLQIIGYDGFDIKSTDENVFKLLKTHYKDPSKAFGHEAVLFCMLVLNEEELKYFTIEN